MRLYRETTDWDTPNHTYLLDDSKQYMHGYIKLGAADVEMFKSPIRFSTRGRSFQFVSAYNQDTPASTAAVIEVLGSKGDKYYVTLGDSDASCSCTGFKYRGECKHQDLARKALLYL
jgi:hypothetical protein